MREVEERRCLKMISRFFSGSILFIETNAREKEINNNKKKLKHKEKEKKKKTPPPKKKKNHVHRLKTPEREREIILNNHAVKKLFYSVMP